MNNQLVQEKLARIFGKQDEREAVVGAFLVRQGKRGLLRSRHAAEVSVSSGIDTSPLRW